MRSALLWRAWAALAVIFALTGPFGTAESLTLPLRAAYWSLVLAIAWVLGMAHVALAVRLGARIGLRARWATLAGAAASGPLVTTVVHLIRWATLGVVPETGDWAFSALRNAGLAAVAASLAILAATSRRDDAAERRRRDPATRGHRDANDAAPPRPKILDRLPPNRRGALIRLEMHDHYVQVVTEAGGHLLLMRLTDAEAECAPTPGARVHRSHWVARAAVDRAERRGGAWVLHARDGAEVPVARARTAELREAGWFD